MVPKLLFITSHYFYPFAVQALQRLRLNCRTHVTAYDDFEHIARIYAGLEEQYDACFVSGTSAEQAIRLGCGSIRKPLVSFQVSSDGLHQAILRLAVEQSGLDFSRTAIDFLLPLEQGYSVKDYVLMQDFSRLVEQTNQRMSDECRTAPDQIEAFILDRIRQLWTEGKIDLVFCQYSSLIPRLEEFGIPYRCPFLSDAHLKQIIEDTLIRLELQRQHDNHPAIAQVFPLQTINITSQELDQLHASVLQFMKMHLVDCVIQKTEHCVTVITTMHVVSTMTDGFRNSRLCGWLSEVLPFPVTIGFGIGTTVSHAMNNAQIASREAKLTGSGFVVDTNGQLIGPLNSASPHMVLSPAQPDVSSVARRCNLSAMTVQRICAIIRSTGTDKLTIQDLAKHLGTTVRNANRIMLNLCKGQAAVPVHTQLSHSPGRPVQVYMIDLGISVN